MLAKQLSYENKEISLMKIEGKIFSDGRIKFELVPSTTEGIGAICFAALAIIFFGWFGLQTIPIYGGDFCEYIFFNHIFYICIGIIIIINAMLFYHDISVTDTAIIESVAGFLAYIVLGCNAYSLLGAWEEMSIMLEKICSFFGIIFMSLFFSLFSVLICVGMAAGIVCKITDPVEDYENHRNGDVPNSSLENEIKWTCYKCGTQNMSNTTWCTFCGKQTRIK